MINASNSIVLTAKKEILFGDVKVVEWQLETINAQFVISKVLKHGTITFDYKNTSYWNRR